MGEMLFTRQESHKGPPLLGEMVADRAAQHRILRLKRVEQKALGRDTLELDLGFSGR
jgi:hypothetical protein